MKVCKYCETQSQDNVSVCPGCGASDFMQRCPNCSTVYDGIFCPNCGVRAGARAKRCPNCGASYFSQACPDCGYVKNAVNAPYPTSTFTTRAPAQPAKPRKTWLWVLGWIFIFPVPLTILLLRSQKLGKVMKIVFIVLAWLFYIYVFGSDSDAAYTEAEHGQPTCAAAAAEL